MFNEEFFKDDEQDAKAKTTVASTNGNGAAAVPASKSASAARFEDSDDEDMKKPKRNPKDQKFRCRFCGLEYSYMNTLKAHERVHDVEEPYICPSCGMSFRYHSELQGHSLQHRAVPGEKVYKCMCGRTFNKYTDLLYHKHPDDEEEPVYQETASAGGKEPAYLWKYPDSRKTYFCEFCLKGYASSHDLKYHIYSHRGERQFSIGASRYLMNRTQ